MENTGNINDHKKVNCSMKIKRLALSLEIMMVEGGVVVVVAMDTTVGVAEEVAIDPEEEGEVGLDHLTEVSPSSRRATVRRSMTKWTLSTARSSNSQMSTMTGSCLTCPAGVAAPGRSPDRNC